MLVVAAVVVEGGVVIVVRVVMVVGVMVGWTDTHRQTRTIRQGHRDR